MNRKPMCSNHERRIRRIERYGRIIIGALAVLLLRGDNPENLKWILRFVGIIIPEAHANNH